MSVCGHKSPFRPCAKGGAELAWMEGLRLSCLQAGSRGPRRFNDLAPAESVDLTTPFVRGAAYQDPQRAVRKRHDYEDRHMPNVQGAHHTDSAQQGYHGHLAQKHDGKG
eukprot:CAMPEP_0117537308 /NCGR_PEP_ID=MMETSP0784-20121206/41896_1 /TAXON_ID=39447 /ORGANISM="" /LENGTH=108 /DNA_ID=CAMNT_0005333887 /DNA_START=301 /DNA_END=628 /DNA_ORIENTATION=+